MQLKKFLIIIVLLGLGQQLLAQQDNIIYKKKVYFEFNKWDIRKQDKKALSLIIKATKAQQHNYVISIIGHTDNVDNNRYNYQLGLKRAKAVASYLVKRGVDSTKLKLYSKGEEQKAASNSKDSLRQLNRRVEIILLKTANGINNTIESVDSSIQITLKGRMIDSATGKPLKGYILLFSTHNNGDNNLLYSFLSTDTFSATIYKGRYEISYASKGFRAKNVNYNFTGNDFSKSQTIEVSEGLRKLKIKRKVSFDKIHFYGNEARFLPSAGSHLRQVLRLAKSKDIAAIEIVGHVNYPYYLNQNNSIKIKDNFELSFNRAKAVYNYLVNNGINGAIITYKGVSNTEMKYPNAIRAEEQQQNRRVEVLILEESIN